MQDEDKKYIAKALDVLALALTDHDHAWNDQERTMYDTAIEKLGAHLTSKDFEPTIRLVSKR